MAEHKASVFIKQAGAPVQKDRCTVVITGHYQEWDPSNTTHSRIAYDRLLEPECVPHQTALRVNPGTRTPVPYGEATPGKCELMLAHEVPKMYGDNPNSEILLQAQKDNVIKIFNANSVQLGMIYPNRGCVFHFAEPVFVEATHATALLKISVFPA
jgi:hypothetical protein